MIVNFAQLESGRVLQADICIVGMGASGITLARELAATRLDVILLESGSYEVDDRFEQLNEGEVSGFPFGGLRGGRRRGLGGTTAAWGGQCCELDVDDFEKRPWIAHTGWPLTYADLVPFYRRAESVFGVSGEAYDESVWSRFGIRAVKLDPNELRTSFSVFSPAPRIGKVYRKLIEQASNLRLIVGATVTNIGTNESGSQATHVDVQDFDGRRIHVSARNIVLCTGTIDTARLLLASRDVSVKGIGNDRDLVGRYFQDHPTSYTAQVIANDTRRVQELYGVLFRGKTWFWPKISLAPALQHETGVLNGAACVMFKYDSPAIEILREMVRVTRTGGRFPFTLSQIATLVRGGGDIADAGFRRYILGRSPQATPSRIELMCTIEQAPDPESRVVLGDSKDRFGMPRVRVEWKLGDAEARTFQTLTAAADAQFRQAGLGVVEPEPWLSTTDIRTWPVWDNFHQLGTTRMSTDPSTGVVDENGQVHGVNGLFVAGSPTFPASGYANPVLTNAALTIRLADFLKKLTAQRSVPFHAGVN